MRSLLGLVLPVVLSFHVIACVGGDESEPQPPAASSQSDLVAAGGACESSDECKSGLTCDVATNSSLGVRGAPAMADPCDVDPNGEGCVKPKGKPTGVPTPAPTPANDDPKPSGAPTPEPAPAPIAKRFCTAH